MYSDSIKTDKIHPLANNIRTILLIHVDEELKKSRNLNFKINSETVSYTKNDDLYVMLEDALYDSSNNKSEVYSVSSCNSWQKFTPSDGRNSSSIKLFSNNLSSDPRNYCIKSHKFIYEKNYKTSLKINRSPSLKKKDIRNEINFKSDLKTDVFKAYRKLKKLAFDLKNDKRRKSFINKNHSDSNSLKNALKDGGVKVFSSKNSSNNSSFQSDNGIPSIFLANNKSIPKVIEFLDNQEKLSNQQRGNMTPKQEINHEFFQSNNVINKPFSKKYSFPSFNKSYKKVDCFNIKLNKCM